MLRLRIERAWDWWRGFANSPAGFVLRRIVRTVIGIFFRFLRMLLWRLRLVWARMSVRVRVAVSLVVLVLISAQTSSLAPSISAATEALAVLLIAGVGLWIIASAPFRRRRPW